MLLETDDGPLPEDFQRSSHAYELVYEVVASVQKADEIMRRLAPVFGTHDGYVYNPATRSLKLIPDEEP